MVLSVAEKGISEQRSEAQAGADGTYTLVNVGDAPLSLAHLALTTRRRELIPAADTRVQAR